MSQTTRPIDPGTKDQIVVEPDRVLIYDDLAVDLIMGIEWSETPNLAAFEDAFERFGEFQASPDRHQGLDMICVIRRKSDARLFGCGYWQDISKHGEAFVESNADAHGIEWEIPDGYDWNNDYYPNVFVFSPVEPFAIQGYRTIKKEEGK